MTLIKSISGIRGTIGGGAGEGLNPLDIVKFTSAYATLIRKTCKSKSNKIVVGRDARISGENKAWAQTVPMPEGSEDGNRRSHWVVDSHPGLVNLFVDQVRDLVREREKEKPSVIQQLKQEPTAGKTKAAHPKKREPER